VNAKEVTNGPTNAKATWTCTGFENRVTNKYPVCPAGQRVERIMQFPNCWDGKNTDSANHRTHIVFAKANGQWPERHQGGAAAGVRPGLPVGAQRLGVRGGRLRRPAAQSGDRPRRLGERDDPPSRRTAWSAASTTPEVPSTSLRAAATPAATPAQHRRVAARTGAAPPASPRPGKNQSVTCPDVRAKMSGHPASVQSSVNQDLDQMDNFLNDANNRLQAAGSQATPTSSTTRSSARCRATGSS